MPTKPNRAGQQQSYVPAGNGDASGEYGDKSTGSNKHFTNFKKEDSAFESANKQRLGSGLSSQPKVAEPIKETSSAFDKWAHAIMTQERVGNPPEEIKVRVKDTPIERVDDDLINETIAKGYNPQTVGKAAELLRKYEGSVDETAQDLENIADNLGGMMVGMGFRLKRLGSMTRKLESYVIEEHEKGNTTFTIDDALGKMRDVARFTMCFDENNFEGEVQKAMSKLERQGYKMVRAKNTFTEGASYKGLNCNFIDKKGNIFELQFHVPNSMKIKEGIEVDLKNKRAVSNRRNITAHDLYETTRVIEDKMRQNKATEEEKQLYNELTQEGKKRWATVPNFDFAFLK